VRAACGDAACFTKRTQFGAISFVGHTLARGKREFGGGYLEMIEGVGNINSLMANRPIWTTQFRAECTATLRGSSFPRLSVIDVYYWRVTKTVRTVTFSRRAKRLLPEAEIARLEQFIGERPDAHPVIAGTGGVRKARWARPGMGKRGGVRAVYYFQTRAGIVYMLDVYAKNEKADLTPADKRELRAIVSLIEEAQ